MAKKERKRLLELKKELMKKPKRPKLLNLDVIRVVITIKIA